MSLRTCVYAECAEYNDADAIHCATCGRRLVPQERYLRVRSHIQHVSDGIDADEVAAGIVADIERRTGAVPWPKKKAAA